MQLSLFGATFVRMGHAANDVDADEHRRGTSPWTAEVDGFNLHAGVVIEAGERDGLERLCRYGARPPFSLERLSLLPGGRVAYRLRRPRKNGATHLVMTPVQCLARIAALIAPPRFPLLRFSGVFAPRSSWRSAVVAMRPAKANAADRLPHARTTRSRRRRLAVAARPRWLRLVTRRHCLSAHRQRASARAS